jgi:hypothetical protein
MIRSSACPLRQADPAQSGRHGDRRSYTTPWDTIDYDHRMIVVGRLLIPMSSTVKSRIFREIVENLEDSHCQEY